MQIHLKQKEIEQALTMYIAQQGINLNNKTIEVTFTASRKGDGITAEMTIEEDPTAELIPGFEVNRVSEEPATVSPLLEVVKTSPVGETPEQPKEEVAAPTQEAEPPFVVEPKKTSIFG